MENGEGRWDETKKQVEKGEAAKNGWVEKAGREGWWTEINGKGTRRRKGGTRKVKAVENNKEICTGRWNEDNADFR